MILDGFQAGLSWITVLKKRENYRKAFDNFSAEKIATYDQEIKEMKLNGVNVELEKCPIIVHWNTPFLIVILLIYRILNAFPVASF